ncbi:MAG: hypothetical protein H6512_14560 [Acidimicrobiia bacterium]|nr:hypothetical protein [Acidimicrobiia bacterium]
MAITGDTISLEERWATATVEAGAVSAVAFTNKPTDTQLQIDKQTDGGGWHVPIQFDLHQR